MSRSEWNSCFVLQTSTNKTKQKGKQEFRNWKKKKKRTSYDPGSRKRNNKNKRMYINRNSEPINRPKKKNIIYITMFIVIIEYWWLFPVPWWSLLRLFILSLFLSPPLSLFFFFLRVSLFTLGNERIKEILSQGETPRRENS